MRKIYVSSNFLFVGHLREVLEANDIRCVTRNELLIGAMGELPPTECWPELWITDNHHYEKAAELVRAMLAIDMEAADDWRCPACAEPLEGQFSECWNCGRARLFDD